MSALSPAEKAEQRRQKILAKKKLRMAYVNGDRSQLPSAVPVEITTISQPNLETSAAATISTTKSTEPTTAENTSLARAAEMTAATSTAPMTEPSRQMRVSDCGDVEPGRSLLSPDIETVMRTRQTARRDTYSPSPYTHPPSFHTHAEFTPWKMGAPFRLATWIILAIAYAICLHGDAMPIRTWPVSAVELFLYANLLLHAPQILTYATRSLQRRFGGVTSNSAAEYAMPGAAGFPTSRLIGGFNWLRNAYSVLGTLASDFALYSTAFLCASYIISINSASS